MKPGRLWNLSLSLLLVWGVISSMSVEASAGDKVDAPLAADLVSDGKLIDTGSERYQALFRELQERHQFEPQELERIFSGVTIRKRVLELMDRQTEAKPYYEYFPLLVNDEIIREGRMKLAAHSELLSEIENRFGVDREILVAIWGIESKFGKSKGGFNLFQTLNTMFDAYPRRSAFYRGELIAFLLLCRENGVDPRTVNGSYGGAFGQTQFIPSSFREYAVDFDGDGRRDVWESVPDVLASIANYLKRFKWTIGTPVYWELGNRLLAPELEDAFHRGRKGLVTLAAVEDGQQITLPKPPGNGKLTVVGLELDASGAMRYVAGYPNFQAITAWNNSNRYAMAVTELAERLRVPRTATAEEDTTPRPGATLGQ